MNWDKIIGEFENYLKEKKVTYTDIGSAIAMMNRIQLWEDLSDVKFENWNKWMLQSMLENGVSPKKEDILKYEMLGVHPEELKKLSSGICSTTYFSFRSRMHHTNTIMKFLKRDDLIINIKEFEVKIEIKTDNLLSKEEVINLCNMLTNVQDKFIIYAIFSGIKGTGYSDLVELKMDDVDLKNKEIKLPSGIIIEIDEYMEDILTDLLDPEFGRFYYKLNRSGYYDATRIVEFNWNSPYVLKVVPMTNNNDGIGCMSYQGMQTRLKGLSTALGVNLTGSDLYKAGIIEKLHEKDPSRKHWTQQEIKDFLSETGLSMQMYDLQRKFEEKYGDKKTLRANRL